MDSNDDRPQPSERNPDAAAHYEDGARRALGLVRAAVPSRYRGIVDDVARQMGIKLS